MSLTLDVFSERWDIDVGSLELITYWSENDISHEECVSK